MQEAVSSPAPGPGLPGRRPSQASILLQARHRSHLIVVSITRARQATQVPEERLGRAGGPHGDPGVLALRRMSLRAGPGAAGVSCLSPLKIWQAARCWVSEPVGRCWRRQGGHGAAVGHAVPGCGPAGGSNKGTRGGRRRERPGGCIQASGTLISEASAISPVNRSCQATVQAGASM